MRRLSLVGLVPILVVLALGASACGDDDGAVQVGTSVPAPTSSAPAPPSTASSSTSSTSSTSTTRPSTTTSSAPTTTTTTSAPLGPSLPADDRPRTPPVDAAEDLGDIGEHPSFDELAAAVTAALEARYPAEEQGQTTTSASASANSAGTVLFRVDGLADDSLAGWDYTVEAVESGGAWTVASASKVAICRRGVSGDLCV